jgi:hypothetical protein
MTLRAGVLARRGALDEAWCSGAGDPDRRRSIRSRRNLCQVAMLEQAGRPSAARRRLHGRALRRVLANASLG